MMSNCKYTQSKCFVWKVISQATGRLNNFQQRLKWIMSRMNHSNSGEVLQIWERDFARFISGTVVIMLPLIMNFWKTRCNWLKERTRVRSEWNYCLSVVIGWRVYAKKRLQNWRRVWLKVKPSFPENFSCNYINSVLTETLWYKL